MMRVFACGGWFDNPGHRIVAPDLPPVKGVPCNCICPCGSGVKAKRCCGAAGEKEPLPVRGGKS